MWLLRGYYVVTMWLICGYYVVTMTYVVTMWLLCGYYDICGYYVVTMCGGKGKCLIIINQCLVNSPNDYGLCFFDYGKLW